MSSNVLRDKVIDHCQVPVPFSLLTGGWSSYVVLSSDLEERPFKEKQNQSTKKQSKQAKSPNQTKRHKQKPNIHMQIKTSSHRILN